MSKEHDHGMPRSFTPHMMARYPWMYPNKKPTQSEPKTASIIPFPTANPCEQQDPVKKNE